MHFATRYAESPMINHIVRHLACNATLVNKISVSLSLSLSLAYPLTWLSHLTRGGTLPTSSLHPPRTITRNKPKDNYRSARKM